MPLSELLNESASAGSSDANSSLYSTLRSLLIGEGASADGDT